MNRSLLAAFGVLVAIALAGRVRSYHAPLASGVLPSQGLPAATTLSTSPVSAAQTALRTTSVDVPPAVVEDETSLMEHLRLADPATMLALAREGNKRYPGSAATEERDARAIDALVALDHIGEAHTEAMLFVQHHPSGPFTAHVANLMGVHPRPPGAVPEPAAAQER